MNIITSNKLSHDINLRGYAFEYITKVHLRRYYKNNFIFLVSQIRDIAMFIAEYRLDFRKQQQFLRLIRTHRLRGDIIVFCIDNFSQRIVESIVIYDVKTCHNLEMVEVCLSNADFYRACVDAGIKVKFAVVLLQLNWNYQVREFDFGEIPMREYTRNESLSVRNLR